MTVPGKPEELSDPAWLEPKHDALDDVYRERWRTEDRARIQDAEPTEAAVVDVVGGGNPHYVYEARESGGMTVSERALDEQRALRARRARALRERGASPDAVREALCAVDWRIALLASPADWSVADDRPACFFARIVDEPAGGAS